jgi:hypothetical protein
MVPENWKVKMEMLRLLARGREGGGTTERARGGGGRGPELADGVQAPQEVEEAGTWSARAGTGGRGASADGEGLGGRRRDAASG